MVIKKAVLEMIADISSGMGYELGGILGSSLKGIITDVAADTPTDKVGCRFEYRPNTALLNKQIEKWAEEGIAFAGLFHTHFSGSRTLSDADKGRRKGYSRLLVFSCIHLTRQGAECV